LVLLGPFLDTAAKTLPDNQHYGYLVAGKFSRGYRGGARYDLLV